MQIKARATDCWKQPEWTLELCKLEPAKAAQKKRWLLGEGWTRKGFSQKPAKLIQDWLLFKISHPPTLHFLHNPQSPPWFFFFFFSTSILSGKHSSLIVSHAYRQVAPIRGFGWASFFGVCMLTSSWIGRNQGWGNQLTSCAEKFHKSVKLKETSLLLFDFLAIFS